MSIRRPVERAVQRDPGTPAGISIGIGAVVMVAAGLIAAMVPVSQPGWRFAVMAIAVGLFAAVAQDQVALAAVALIAFLISNGFLEDRFGQLAWHGSADVWRMLLLVMAAAWGLAVGEAYRFVRDLRFRRSARASQPASTAAQKEEKHGA